MVILKTPAQIDKMRKVNDVVAKILLELKSFTEPGINTLLLDDYARKLAEKHNVRPAFLGYKGYKYCISTSVNDVVVHGCPDERTLKEGDIIGIDFGAEKNGFFGDAAITFPVGKVPNYIKKLISVTEDALYGGIKHALPGNRIHDISYAVQQIIELSGFHTITDFVGHGIGANLHEDPSVPNRGKPNTGIPIKPGMVLAIEPMVSMGTDEIEILPDGWSARIKDGSYSAHFEHTVAITEDGNEILSINHNW